MVRNLDGDYKVSLKAAEYSKVYITDKVIMRGASSSFLMQTSFHCVLTKVELAVTPEELVELGHTVGHFLGRSQLEHKVESRFPHAHL